MRIPAQLRCPSILLCVRAYVDMMDERVGVCPHTYGLIVLAGLHWQSLTPTHSRSIRAPIRTRAYVGMRRPETPNRMRRGSEHLRLRRDSRGRPPRRPGCDCEPLGQAGSSRAITQTREPAWNCAFRNCACIGHVHCACLSTIPSY